MAGHYDTWKLPARIAWSEVLDASADGGKAPIMKKVGKPYDCSSACQT
jgi:hypothetical protein